MQPVAFIFPAFVSEYLGCEMEMLGNYNSDFKNKLQSASELIDEELKDFDFIHNPFKDKELKSQLISYAFSCSLSEMLRNEKIIPAMTSGYSMGIYATLYNAGCFDYEDGLRIIYKAFEVISEEMKEMEFGMGGIVGLDYQDIILLMQPFPGKISIANTHNPNNFILSGYREEIIEVLALAKNEGALHTVLMPVKCPYHSAILKDCSIPFSAYLKTLNIRKPIFPVISTINQQILTNAEQAREEMVKNLFTPINWMLTVQKFAESGISSMLECGAGETLYKIGKFIPGDYRMYSIRQINHFIRDFKSLS
jgi:[acyl-carrier-protein] S-malonyltransferase